MSFLRKFVYQATGFVFKVLLVLLPFIFGLAVVFANPASLEQAAKGSNVYTQLVDVVLDNSQQQVQDPQIQRILADPGVRAAIEKSFPPQLLETAGNSVIEGVFAWLQGNTPEPQFSVDLSSAKTALVANLRTFAEKRASGLPACTTEQLQSLKPNSDLLSLPCIPAGTDVAALGQQFSDQLLADTDFLDKPVIDNKTLAKENGQSITSDISQLPKAYQASQTGKWAILGLTALLGLLLIVARRDRRAGARHVAWGLISVAIFWGIALIVYWFLFDITNTVGASSNGWQAMLLDGGKVLLSDLNRVIGVFATTYAVLGGTLLLILRLTEPKADKPIPAAVTETAPTETPAQTPSPTPIDTPVVTAPANEQPTSAPEVPTTSDKIS